MSDFSVPYIITIDVQHPDYIIWMHIQISNFDILTLGLYLKALPISLCKFRKRSLFSSIGTFFV